jgi:hypothetical protein
VHRDDERELGEARSGTRVAVDDLPLLAAGEARVLNNRQHAECVATFIDRTRENGTAVSSREKGYWLDLLEYRNDETGRCNPGQRELMTKTGCTHRTLRQMDARAAELNLYTVETYKNKQGPQRKRFIWNPYALSFTNDNQPTRVRSHSSTEQMLADRRDQTDTTRDQMITKNTSLSEEEGPRKGKQRHLRDQVITTPGERVGAPQKSAFASFRRLADRPGRSTSSEERNKQDADLDELARTVEGRKLTLAADGFGVCSCGRRGRLTDGLCADCRERWL